MSRLAILFPLLSLAASPAVAGKPYIGLEAGFAIARSNDVDETVEYVGTPVGAAVPQGGKYDDVFGVQYKDGGADLGVVAGYDFGWFRLEGELAQKRVGLRRNVEDDITGAFLADVNGALNRPPQPGSPGRDALTIADFQPSGSLKVGSAMVNTLFDFGVNDRLTLFVGGGLGRSFARGFGDRDGARAGQYMLGARYGVGRQVEVGLKYRYFNSGVIKLDHDPMRYRGNANGGQTVDALVTPDIEGEFRTRSLLASFIYNWR